MNYDVKMVFPALADKILVRFADLGSVIRTAWLSFWWGIKGHGRFKGPTIIRTRHYGEIVIGKRSVFNSVVRTNLSGITGPNILDTRQGGKIIVGSHSGLTAPVISSRTKIEIGSYVNVGSNVRIFDHDFHSLDPSIRAVPNEDYKYVRSKPIWIGDHVFIGANTIILKGTRVGDRSIIAAGSVVFGLNIPEDSMVKGNPAIIVQRRRDVEHEEIAMG